MNVYYLSADRIAGIMRRLILDDPFREAVKAPLFP
jgi:hypothetical protein